MLEVLITIGILSVGVVFILQALSFSAKATGVSCDFIKAAFLAEDLTGWLEFKEAKKQVSSVQKSDNKDGYQWSYTSSLDSALNLYVVNLQVSWERSGRQEKINLSTYLR